jgi:signal transduction histidine kinase
VLAIVKSIVEAHGGHVAIASTPGQGTRVTLALPLA